MNKNYKHASAAYSSLACKHFRFLEDEHEFQNFQTNSNCCYCILLQKILPSRILKVKVICSKPQTMTRSLLFEEVLSTYIVRYKSARTLINVNLC